MGIESQRQSKLPTRKAIRIGWKSIRIRWWRSILVTTGIVLALAFLTYVLYSDAMQRSVAKRGSPELLDRLRREGQMPGQDADAKVQTRWMIGLALLISFVGILNAMVLNVTERFREIGTMKCLGALDSSIIKLYLIESLFQGLGRTVVGIALGGVLALIEGITTYGVEAFSLVSAATILRTAGLCALAGLLLSMGGALYPAWLAARMEPVDAMRSEV